MRYLAFLISFFSALSYASWDVSSFNKVLHSSSGPTRLGFIKMRSQLDQAKSLAMVDLGGFVALDESLVGEVSPGEIASINLKNGIRNWTLISENKVAAPILLNKDYLYIPFLDATVAKVDKLSGELKWRSNVPNIVARAMTIQGSRLYFVTGMQELGSIDIQSGKQEWVAETMRPAGLQLLNVSAPIVDDGMVFVGNQAGRIEGFDLKNGVRQFSSNLGSIEGRFSDIVATPVIIGQLIVTARYDGLVAAFDRKSPEKSPVWKVRVGPVTELKSYSGSLYLTTASGELISLNPVDGKTNWKSSLGSSLSVMELRETSILTSGPSGLVAKLDRSTGKLDWQDQLESNIISPPLYYGGGLWFLTGLGNLYGYLIH